MCWTVRFWYSPHVHSLIVADYAYLSNRGRGDDDDDDDDESHRITLIVVRDSMTGSDGASPVSSQGATVESVSYAVGFIRSLEH